MPHTEACLHSVCLVHKEGSRYLYAATQRGRVPNVLLAWRRITCTHVPRVALDTPFNFSLAIPAADSSNSARIYRVTMEPSRPVLHSTFRSQNYHQQVRP